jgi:hypothetical protein
MSNNEERAWEEWEAEVAALAAIRAACDRVEQAVRASRDPGHAIAEALMDEDARSEPSGDAPRPRAPRVASGRRPVLVGRGQHLEPLAHRAPALRRLRLGRVLPVGPVLEVDPPVPPLVAPRPFHAASAFTTSGTTS